MVLLHPLNKNWSIPTLTHEQAEDPFMSRMLSQLYNYNCKTKYTTRGKGGK
jgi:hypothetical protein